jgi:putative tryptophan/tyrosine transport system substrate-binding protein
MMKRRAFIILGGAAVACPVRARAQQPAKLPRIGFLGLVPESLAGDGLRAGLRDVGYVEGNNILIEWRWAQNVGELPESRGRSRAHACRCDLRSLVDLR